MVKKKKVAVIGGGVAHQAFTRDMHDDRAV